MRGITNRIRPQANHHRVSANSKMGLDLEAWSKVYDQQMVTTISKLGAEVGLTPGTIRYYERAGPLPSPNRSGSGYRLYGKEDAERLRFIRGARRLGLRLRDVRELLTIRDRGACPCGHIETLVKRRIADFDTEIKRMKRLREQLLRLSETLHPDSRPDAEPWPCDQEFINLGGGGS